MLSMPPDSTISGTGTDDVVRQHGGLHAGAADLVDGGGAGGIRQFGAARGLPRRGLTLSGRQHAAHEYFVDPLRREFCALDRRADHMGTELVGAKRGQIAHEFAQRRAGGGNDDDGIGACGHAGHSIEQEPIGLQTSYDAVQNSAMDHADDNYTSVG